MLPPLVSKHTGLLSAVGPVQLPSSSISPSKLYPYFLVKKVIQFSPLSYSLQLHLRHKLAMSTKPDIAHVLTHPVQVSLQDHVHCGLMHLKSNMVHRQEDTMYFCISF